MEQYCERTLSYESDALRAISGTLNLLLKDEQFHLWGVPGRILKPVSTDREKHQQTHQQMSSIEAAPKFADFHCSVHLDWTSNKGRRRLGFPSWSPLGWSSTRVYWEEEAPYIGRISFHTSLGQEKLSKYIEYVRTDHIKVPQQLSLSLKTAIVEVCDYGKIALSLDSRAQLVYPYIEWDTDKPTDGTCLKAAAIAENESRIFLLLLEATDDNIYERCGSCFLEKVYNISGLRIWYDDLEEEGSSHERDDGGTWTFVKNLKDLNPADRERLRVPQGDLGFWEWWNDLPFTEERLIIG